MSDYSTVDKMGWFIQKMTSGWFSRPEIGDLATAEFPSIPRKIDPGVKAQIVERMEKMAIPPAAIARAIAFAIEQSPEVDVNEIVIRPTAQA